MAPSVPTRGRDWRLMARTSRLVLSLPGYAALAVVAAVAALSTFTLSQNLGFVRAVVVFNDGPLVGRLQALLGLYPGFAGSYSPASATLIVVTSALVGLNIALVTYHFREHGLGAREGGGSLAGVVLGMLGAGCAACGSAMLAGLLAVFGVGVGLTALPLHGLEISLLAVAATLLSVHWITQGMRGGEVAGCPVDID
ncbi:hypothetical protein JCM30237_03940 [Halolamina litorea]|uniref:Sulphur transport domain-containing protein n=1 Tax=Halolamina litorea TaxID=1515593 RepID=A0ABD6BQ46_9EURY|nr:hypothetical protein [Halolamina litorea]